MDIHNLNVRRVPGVVSGWSMEEQGVLTNTLCLASVVSFKPTHDWLCQHIVVIRLRIYLYEQRGRGYKKKATNAQSWKPEFKMWLCH